MRIPDRLIGPAMLGAGLAAYVALGVAVSCSAPSAHVANVAEGAQQAAELTDCRAKGRAAKADGGGAEGYMQAYEACAEIVDRKHGRDQ